MVYSTELNPPHKTGWLINKFFPGKEQIKWKMSALVESGILSHLETLETIEYKTRHQLKQRELQERSDIKALSLDNLKGIFATLLLGHCLSTLIIIVEFIKFYFYDK